MSSGNCCRINDQSTEAVSGRTKRQQEPVLIDHIQTYEDAREHRFRLHTVEQNQLPQ
jgi:hypothetical protein